MKIALFLDAYKPTVDGAVRTVESFAGQAREMGHEVYIFAPAAAGYRDRDPWVFRIPSLRLPDYPQYRFGLPPLPRIIYRVDRLGIDVIHAQTPFMIGCAGLLTGKFLKIPVVFTHHTFYSEYATYFPCGGFLARRGLPGLMRLYCNHSDVVIALSSAGREELLRFGVRNTINVVPTGIEFDYYNPDPEYDIREQYGIDPATPILVVTGRVIRQKNLGFLLRVARMLKRDGYDFRLFIVGTGGDLDGLKAESEALGLQDRVIFTGFIEDSHRFSCFYAQADLFVFASLTETQGLVIIEAMYNETPAVVVRARGAADMVKDGVDGFLVPHDERAFVEKVELLLDRPDLRRSMAAAAREKALTFDGQGWVRRQIDFYARALDSKRRQRGLAPLMKNPS